MFIISDTSNMYAYFLLIHQCLQEVAFNLAWVYTWRFMSKVSRKSQAYKLWVNKTLKQLSFYLLEYVYSFRYFQYVCLLLVDITVCKKHLMWPVSILDNLWVKYQESHRLISYK